MFTYDSNGNLLTEDAEPGADASYRAGLAFNPVTGALYIGGSGGFSNNGLSVDGKGRVQYDSGAPAVYHHGWPLSAVGAIIAQTGAIAAGTPFINGAFIDGSGIFVSDASGSVWSPSALFASSEVGVWYDPSDLSTMFTFVSGTQTPAILNQGVGLILDKSQGLALGTENVTNGDFSGGTTGWSNLSATSMTVVDGKLRITRATDGLGYVGQMPTTLVSGKWYKLTFDIDTFAITGKLFLGTASYGSQYYTNHGLTTGSYTVVFQATQTNLYITLAVVSSTSGRYVDFDNISVKEVAGNHAYQATTASRPVLRESGGLYYLEFDGVDDVLTCSNPNLGTDATLAIALAAGASISQNQTIGANYAYNTDDSFGLILVDRNLTAGEVTDLTAYLDGKAGA